MSSLFTCAFGGGFILNVAMNLSYSVERAGSPWLDSGTLAIYDGISFLSPGAGLIPGQQVLGSASDDELGDFSFLSTDWASNSSSSSTPFATSNFTCYDVGIVSFSITFPFGMSSFGGTNELPLTHFPSFPANSDTFLRSQDTGFIEWAGEMSEYGDKHGVALEGFAGGRQSGLLLLFNKSALDFGASERAPALILGPGSGEGSHLVHTVIRLLSSSTEESYVVDPSCIVANHTDKIGGGNAPGSGSGLVVQQNNVSACCAACKALGDDCDAYVYDTNGFAGDGHNCWPIQGITGSEQASDRVLGLNSNSIRCSPQPGTSPSADAVPSTGFSAGQILPSPDACCVLCTTLGSAECSGWFYNSDVNTCYPLLSFQGTVSGPASHTFGKAVSPPSQLVVGVQGMVESLPPGFVVKAWIAGSSDGLSDATMQYGNALRISARLHRMTKENDAMRNLVSYWSDNGAFYFDGYWPLFFNATTNTAQDVFLRLKAYHQQLGLTVGTYQMDPWWAGGSCGASGPPSPECNNPKAWPWSANWSAAPGFFPDGLKSLGLPLTLYSNLYAQLSNGNKMTQFSWLNDSCTGIAPCAVVIPEQSYDFHTYIFDIGKNEGMNAFEIDFADYIFPFQEFAVNVRSMDQYFEGVDTAATEHEFPVQLCMSLPLLMLNSVHWPSVTNARLQGDGYPTSSGRYDIFQTSLLYSSIAVSPFLDNIWTTSCQPAVDNPFGNSTCEGNVEMLAAIATLSTGPVGFADRVGLTNSTLLNMTTRSDGVLLQPSLPAINIDVYFADRFPPQSESSGLARIACAPSFVPIKTGDSPAPPLPEYSYPLPSSENAALFLNILGAFVGARVNLSPIDLWPPLPLPGSEGVTGYYIQSLSRRFLCIDGENAIASGCANFTSNNNASETLLTSMTGPYDHELYSVAPIHSSSNWALLGELSKFTRISSSRISSIDLSPSCGSSTSSPFCINIVGGSSEIVVLTMIDPNGTVRISTSQLSQKGVGRIVCSCSSPSQCSC